MKLLLDFLPLILFFTTFKFAEGHKDAAAEFATGHVGMLTSGGVVTPDQAPMLLATLVAIAATLLTVAWLRLRGRPVEPMTWITLAMVTVLGGLTVWFHDETFIKWKPTGVYWALAAVYWGSAALGKNLLALALGGQLRLPAPAWAALNRAWILFFVAMGLLNIAVAYTVSTPTWVNFKVFGATGLMVAFIVGQTVWISKAWPDAAAEESTGDGPTA
ncbi:septation protein A [Ideonella sp. 4Y16]|uniref:Inner membrane-spanning protein YciB n=1 Tax=Ideonella alba TaxID=2824118 RepID=A0A941BFM7_9BURK|nr:septation protein A [Ideonella alba]MBQ0932236.1 septation protein A [Ideonella alba]MBQ0943741.1 septation protein A [Ideonella alba]